MKYIRNCPQCCGEIEYKTYSTLILAEKKKTLCKECRFGENKYFRNCPNCNQPMGYIKLSLYKKATKENKCCRQCKNKIKHTNCKVCNKELEYKTNPPTYCKPCWGEYRKTLTASRNCPCCGSIINYNTVYDMKKAEEKKSLCNKCFGKEHSKKRKGKTLYDTWVEKGMSEKDAMIKWKDFEKRRLESRKGYFHSENTLNKILKSGLSKQYKIQHLTCQGTWERTYIQTLISENKGLPNNGGTTKTPMGNYIPDFEFEDRYVEIKSTFTYKIFNKEKLTIDKKISIQRDKIIWTGENIKPVQLLVLDKKGEILKEEWYTKEGVIIKINKL